MHKNGYLIDVDNIEKWSIVDNLKWGYFVTCQKNNIKEYINRTIKTSSRKYRKPHKSYIQSYNYLYVLPVKSRVYNNIIQFIIIEYQC